MDPFGRAAASGTTTGPPQPHHRCHRHRLGVRLRQAATSSRTHHALRGHAVRQERGRHDSLARDRPSRRDRERVEYNQSTHPESPAATRRAACPRAWRRPTSTSSIAIPSLGPPGLRPRLRRPHQGADLPLAAHQDMASTAGILESVKAPLEGRVWYAYRRAVELDRRRQLEPAAPRGPRARDGSTQLYTRDHNAFGNLTRRGGSGGTDRVVRLRRQRHRSLEIRQTRDGRTAARRRHHERATPGHRGPMPRPDDPYTYNGRGQLVSRERARARSPATDTARAVPDSIGGPCRGRDGESYDAMGRSDPARRGRPRPTREYDALDRLMRMAPGDGTDEESTYIAPGPASMRDRSGRGHVPVRQQPAARPDDRSGRARDHASPVVSLRLLRSLDRDGPNDHVATRRPGSRQGQGILPTARG